jgi:hypothetical protein
MPRATIVLGPGPGELADADSAVDGLRRDAEGCCGLADGSSCVEETLCFRVVYRLAIHAASHLARIMASHRAIVKTLGCG